MDINVNMGSYERFESGDYVDLGAMGPCIGVLVYDHERMSGLAGHFFPGGKDLVDMVREASGINHAVMYVVGNSVDPHEDTWDVRGYTLETIAEHGFKPVVRWSPPSSDTEFRFDAGTGKEQLVITQYVFDEEDDYLEETVLYDGDVINCPEF